MYHGKPTQKRQAKEAKELEKLEKQIAKVLFFQHAILFGPPTAVPQSGETAATTSKRKELEAKSAAAQVKGSVFYKVTVKVLFGVCIDA